jgi:predicted RNA binding protein YcfA (HicA-like mRNA interferase family)
MNKLPAMTGSQVIRALARAGLIVVRIKGSHHMLEDPGDPTRRTTVPLHKGKALPKGLLHKILHDVQLSAEEFQDFI